MSMSSSAGRQTPKRSSLGLMVLWQLIGEPMHTYRMQKLIEAQGKHRVVNVRSPASLYQTIKRLEHHGLVEVKETIRGSSQPDRTVYTITDSGRDTAREWLRAMLVETRGEYPEFIAAVSILFVLLPEEALRPARGAGGAIGGRSRPGRSRARRQSGASPAVPPRRGIPARLLQAELAWIRAVCADIRGGQLSWDDDWIREVGAKFNPTPEER